MVSEVTNSTIKHLGLVTEMMTNKFNPKSILVNIF